MKVETKDTVYKPFNEHVKKIEVKPQDDVSAEV